MDKILGFVVLDINIQQPFRQKAENAGLVG